MGLANLFSSRELNEMAKSLAMELSRRYPPELDKPGKTKLSVARITKILEDLYSRASSFQDEHRMGWFKKARFGNTFRWELKELGYSDTFIDMATEGLLVYISRAAKKTTEQVQNQNSEKRSGKKSGASHKGAGSKKSSQHR